MRGSVLSFLKAQWKVSDTGSVGWASSSLLHEIHTTYSLVRPSLFSYDSSCEYFLYKRLNFFNKQVGYFSECKFSRLSYL